MSRFVVSVGSRSLIRPRLLVLGVILFVVVLDHRGGGDRLRALHRPALVELALLDVFVHPLLFVADAGQVLLLWHASTIAKVPLHPPALSLPHTYQIAA